MPPVLVSAQRSLFTCLLAMAIAAAITVRATAAEFDHIHLNVSDPTAAAAWYAKHLGGKLTPENVVAFGTVTIRFSKADKPVPGSVGSVIDHLGFAYGDIQTKMRELATSDVEIVSGVEQEGPIKYAFVRDRWNTLLEIVEDADLTGFHHIHLATTDPKTALAWYKDLLGGESARFAGVLPGVRFRDGWVLAKGVQEPRAPTKGRSIDHVGWSVADADQLAEKLKASGLTVEQPKAAKASNAFVEAPGGVRIELVGPAN